VVVSQLNPSVEDVEVNSVRFGKFLFPGNLKLTTSYSAGRYCADENDGHPFI